MTLFKKIESNQELLLEEKNWFVNTLPVNGKFPDLVIQSDQPADFKIKSCPYCKQFTAQEPVSVDPEDLSSPKIWKCTKCHDVINMI